MSRPLKEKKVRPVLSPMTEAGSYILGYLLGDGNIYLGVTANSVDIRSADQEVILKMAGSLGLVEGSLSEVVDKRPRCAVSYRLYINDQEFIRQVMSFGIGPNKSNLGCDGLELPKGFEKHFLRGWLDSDGYVSTSNGGKNLVAGLDGHPSYVKRIGEWYPYPWGFTVNGRVLKARIHADREAQKFMHWLYEGATIWMERKREKFNEFMKSWEQRRHYA